MVELFRCQRRRACEFSGFLAPNDHPAAQKETERARAPNGCDRQEEDLWKHVDRGERNENFLWGTAHD